METELYPIYKEIKPIDIPLDRIFLDPNNPRFVSMKWLQIPVDKIDDESIQKQVQQKLEEEFSVDRLVMNIEINGFLPIDRVIVKEFSEGKYVVLEGNRRICAVKIIMQRYQKNNNSINEEIMQSIQNISCLQYIGIDNEASWVFQGLRHIMGIQDWSAFNKAKLLVDLMEEENLNLSQVGQKFGLTSFGAGQWARGYHAFRQAMEDSDFTKEVDERAYPYFQEVFSRSNVSIREWLGWKEDENRFINTLNFNEFLSWLYPRDTDGYDESVDNSNIKGDWNKRELARSNDLRTVSYLIRNASAEFEQFRVDGDLEKAFSMASAKKYIDESKKMSDPGIEAFDTVESCIKVLENIPLKVLRNNETKEKLMCLMSQLEKALYEIKEAVK